MLQSIEANCMFLKRFTFNEGEVSFTGRMVETANYNKSVAAGKMVPTVTIAHVEPNDWSMQEMVTGVMNFLACFPTCFALGGPVSQPGLIWLI